MPAAYLIFPFHDPRCKPFLQRHPDASVFHSEEWLRSLHKTYGFESAAFTTSSPGIDLQNALLFCRVASPLTGHRLVSLPSSDHCALLLGGKDDLAPLVDAILSQLTGNRLRFAELRPTQPLPQGGPFHRTCTCCLHRLDLTNGPPARFSGPGSVPRATGSGLGRDDTVFHFLAQRCEDADDSLGERNKGLPVSSLSAGRLTAGRLAHH
jgi:hypothetical protein